MKGIETNGPAPRLRFPEFRDAGPWEVKRLGEIGTIIKGKGISKSDIKPDGASPCIRYGELYTFYSEVISEVASRTDADNLVLSEEGDVIIPASGETKEDIATASCVTRRGVALGGDLNIFRSPLNGPFLAYYVRGNLQSEISKVAQGDSVVHLYPAQLERLQLAVPPTLGEQKKIADCLTSLDDLIQAEGEQLASLKDYKRGLMQKLFPRSDEATPRLRFPEFRDAGTWDVKRLGEVCQINPPSGPLPESFFYIDLESVVSGEWILRKRIFRDAAPSRAQRILESGDIIFQMVRPYQKNNLLFTSEVGQEYVASTGYAQLRAKDSSSFLYQLVHTESFTNAVLEKCTGSNYPAISSSDLAEVWVSVPGLPEQQKIADCLTALDELIRAQSGRIKAHKGHKRGLMQQLFPQEVG